MTLHQKILTSAPTSDRSDVFRLRALFCERQARESTGWTSKQDWEVLAIECHTMAHLAARMNGEISQIDVARHVDALWRNRLPATFSGPLDHMPVGHILHKINRNSATGSSSRKIAHVDPTATMPA